MAFNKITVLRSKRLLWCIETARNCILVVYVNLLAVWHRLMHCIIHHGCKVDFLFSLSRIFRVVHARESKNPKELTVRFGDVLEVFCCNDISLFSSIVVCLHLLAAFVVIGRRYVSCCDQDWNRGVFSYWARKYDSAICCSNMSIFVHFATANCWILPSCSVT